MSNNIKINIQEQNLTTARLIPETSDIVYVPGLSPNHNNSNINRPKLYTSAIEFEQDFIERDADGKSFKTDATGNYVKTLHKYTTSDVACACFNDSDAGFITVDAEDRSYHYARNLLSAGIQVYYECVQSEASTNVDNRTNLTFIQTGNSFIAEDSKTFKVELAESDNVVTPVEDTLMLIIPKEYSTLCLSGLKIRATHDDKIAVSITKDNSDSNFEFTNSILKWTNPLTLETFNLTGECVTFKVTISDNGLFTDAENKSEEATVSFVLDILDESALTTANSVAKFYTELPMALTKLLDKNEYSVKYITSGGYPTFNIDSTTDIAEKMLQVASGRGDAIALIDHQYNTTTPLDPSDAESLYVAVCGKEYADDIAGYGAMFTPWATYGDVMLPASYAYLSCLARSLKTTPNFVAIAGVARGLVSGIKELNTGKQVLTSTIAENYQPKRKDTAPSSVDTARSINAITKIRPYGLCIWGNRTLAPITGGEPTAINFLNTRAMLCDIKKVAYTTAKTLMFEQDSDKLWLRFKSGVSGLLDQLKTGYGIKDYKILRKEASGRGRMAAKIQVYPLYAIEFFEIDIVVSDDETSVE